MREVKIEQIGYQLTWQIRHKVMYPDLLFDMIKLEDDDKGLHFGLSVDDERFGFVRSGEVFTKNDIDFVRMELNKII